MDKAKKIKRFVVIESSSGGEVGNVIQAKTKGDAAIMILEEMGYVLEEIKEK